MLPDHHLVQGDAVETLQALPDGAVDLLVTDPAYESLEKHRSVGTTTRLKDSDASSNPWFTVFPNERFPALLAQCHRVLADDAHAYFFCDEETSYVLKPLAEEAGFRFWKSLIWVKTKKHLPSRWREGASPAAVAEHMVAIGMGYHWRASTERILFFEKGKRALNDRSWPDVLFAHRILDGYPTQKPAPLVERLIRNSSDPGDRVADPFCGSGTTGLVARRLERRSWLADLDTTAARERLEAAADVP